MTNSPKHGDVREDGKIFWGRVGTYEDWRDPVKFHEAKKRNKAHKQRLRRIRTRWLGIYKQKKGCQVCGYNEHPAALQFDHIDPLTKIRDVSNMIELKLKRIMDEVRKCRVLCANCHSIHTVETLRKERR